MFVKSLVACYEIPKQKKTSNQYPQKDIKALFIFILGSFLKIQLTNVTFLISKFCSEHVKLNVFMFKSFSSNALNMNNKRFC